MVAACTFVETLSGVMGLYFPHFPTWWDFGDALSLQERHKWSGWWESFRSKTVGRVNQDLFQIVGSLKRRSGLDAWHRVCQAGWGCFARARVGRAFHSKHERRVCYRNHGHLERQQANFSCCCHPFRHWIENLTSRGISPAAFPWQVSTIVFLEFHKCFFGKRMISAKLFI